MISINYATTNLFEVYHISGQKGRPVSHNASNYSHNIFTLSQRRIGMAIMIDRAKLLGKLFPNGIPKRSAWDYSIPARTVYQAIMDVPESTDHRSSEWINAEWIEPPFSVVHGYQCKVCGSKARVSSAYCPSCGRPMRGIRST